MGLNRLSPLIFVISILLFIGIGWVFGEYRLKKQNGAVPIRDSLVTAIFSLSALVLGFAFSTATSNYYSRIDTNRAQASAIKEVYLLIGYTMAIKKEHDWFLAILYVALIGVCLYVILSFEYPQLLMSHQQIDDDLFHLKAFIESSSH